MAAKDEAVTDAKTNRVALDAEYVERLVDQLRVASTWVDGERQVVLEAAAAELDKKTK